MEPLTGDARAVLAGVRRRLIREPRRRREWDKQGIAGSSLALPILPARAH